MNEHRSLTTVNQQIITGMEKYMSAISQGLIDLHLPWQALSCPALNRTHLYTLDMGIRIFNFVYYIYNKTKERYLQNSRTVVTWEELL